LRFLIAILTALALLANSRARLANDAGDARLAA
jgi:hypothetical protein